MRQFSAQGAGCAIEVRHRIEGEQAQVIALHSEHGDAGVVDDAEYADELVVG